MRTINCIDWRKQHQQRQRRWLITSLSLTLTTSLLTSYAHINNSATTTTQQPQPVHCNLAVLQQRWQQHQRHLHWQHRRTKAHNQLISTLERINRSVSPPFSVLQTINLEDKHWHIELIAKRPNDMQHVLQKLNRNTLEPFSVQRLQQRTTNTLYTLENK